jgi:large subunit ribosomal protein L22
MAYLKTNERDGTRAVLRHYRMSATKARVVLDLIRGEDVTTAREILAYTDREAADVVQKLLASAVANAVNNDQQSPDELFVATAYADEGATLKRFSPRARGRAGRINKRSTHITIIVARMDDERLERLRAERTERVAASRARRVAGSRRRADQAGSASRRRARAEAEEATGDEAVDAVDEDVTVVTDEGATEKVADESTEVISDEATENISDEGVVDDAVDEAVDESVDGTAEAEAPGEEDEG